MDSQDKRYIKTLCELIVDTCNASYMFDNLTKKDLKTHGYHLLTLCIDNNNLDYFIILLNKIKLKTLIRINNLYNSEQKNINFCKLLEDKIISDINNINIGNNKKKYDITISINEFIIKHLAMCNDISIDKIFMNINISHEIPLTDRIYEIINNSDIKLKLAKLLYIKFANWDTKETIRYYNNNILYRNNEFNIDLLRYILNNSEYIHRISILFQPVRTDYANIHLLLTELLAIKEKLIKTSLYCDIINIIHIDNFPKILANDEFKIYYPSICEYYAHNGHWQQLYACILKNNNIIDTIKFKISTIIDFIKYMVKNNKFDHTIIAKILINNNKYNYRLDYNHYDDIILSLSCNKIYNPIIDYLYKFRYLKTNNGYNSYNYYDNYEIITRYTDSQILDTEELMNNDFQIMGTILDETEEIRIKKEIYISNMANNDYIINEKLYKIHIRRDIIDMICDEGNESLFKLLFGNFQAELSDIYMYVLNRLEMNIGKRNIYLLIHLINNPITIDCLNDNLIKIYNKLFAISINFKFYDLNTALINLYKEYIKPEYLMSVVNSIQFINILDHMVIQNIDDQIITKYLELISPFQDNFEEIKKYTDTIEQEEYKFINEYIKNIECDKLQTMKEMLEFKKKTNYNVEVDYSVIQSLEISSENIQHECFICFEEYKNDTKVKILKCGHIAHSSCLKEWSINNKCNCPICL